MMSRLAVLLHKECIELWHTKKMMLIFLLALFYPFYLNAIASHDTLVPIDQAIPLLTTIIAVLSGEIIFALMIQERNYKTMDLLLISKLSNTSIFLVKICFASFISFAIAVFSIGVNDILILSLQLKEYVIVVLTIRICLLYACTAMISAMLAYLLFWLPVKLKNIKKYCTLSQVGALLISGLIVKIYLDLHEAIALLLSVFVFYSLISFTLKRMNSYHEKHQEKSYRNVYSNRCYTVFEIIYQRIWHQIKFDKRRLLNLGILILGPFIMHLVTSNSLDSFYFSFLNMLLCSFFSINYLFPVLEEDFVSKNHELFLIANISKKHYAFYHIAAIAWFNLAAVFVHLGLASIMHYRYSGMHVFISFVTIVSTAITGYLFGQHTKDYKTSRIYSAFIFIISGFIYLVLTVIFLR